MYEAAASLHWWTMAKQPQILAQESLTEMLFPLRGIDVACVFDQQPPDSTPVGLNVRAYESLTERARGGSRPGLSRYINAQVSGSNKIQHLTYIVDPQAVALGGGTPPGPPTAPNRNLFGGSGGLAPVRYPVEPGRTYPATGTTFTFTAQFFAGTIGGGFSAIDVATGTLSLNGKQIIAANAPISPTNQDITLNFGPFTQPLLPAGTNKLVVTVFLSVSLGNPNDDYPENFAAWAFASAPYTNSGIPQPAVFLSPPPTSVSSSTTVTF